VYIQENMLSKFGILVAILVMVLLFYFVISFGAGYFSKGEKKPEIKKYLKSVIIHRQPCTGCQHRSASIYRWAHTRPT